MRHELRIGNLIDDYELTLYPDNEEEKYILHLLSERETDTIGVYDGHHSNRKLKRMRIVFRPKEE